MRTPANRYAPYSGRLKGIAAAAAALWPKDEAVKAWKGTCVALDAATRVGADRMVAALVRQADAGLTEALYDPTVTDPLRVAVHNDAAEALSRLAGMIHNNDPDPEYRVQKAS